MSERVDGTFVFDVVLAWYCGLPEPARKRLSVAHLHDLSKQLNKASRHDALITAVEAAIEERRLREVMCACDPDDIEAMRKCATDLGHAIAAHTAALAPFRESGR